MLDHQFSLYLVVHADDGMIALVWKMSQPAHDIGPHKIFPDLFKWPKRQVPFDRNSRHIKIQVNALLRKHIAADFKNEGIPFPGQLLDGIGDIGGLVIQAAGKLDKSMFRTPMGGIAQDDRNHQIIHPVIDLAEPAFKGFGFIQTDHNSKLFHEYLILIKPLLE